MEKIMSKSNDGSFALDLGGDATCTGRILRDDELQKVSGGLKADSELRDDELREVSGRYVYDSTYVVGIVAAQSKTTTACTRMANSDSC